MTSWNIDGGSVEPAGTTIIQYGQPDSEFIQPLDYTYLNVPSPLDLPRLAHTVFTIMPTGAIYANTSDLCVDSSPPPPPPPAPFPYYWREAA